MERASVLLIENFEKKLFQKMKGVHKYCILGSYFILRSERINGLQLDCRSKFSTGGVVGTPQKVTGNSLPKLGL